MMDNSIWDVIIIGGGPAGMMAAGTAASLGKSVLLLEKNPNLGKKLLITGGGRCNLTNNKETRQLVEAYRGAPKALYSVFTQYDVQMTLDFFHRFGMPTKEEDYGRMFPQSDSAESVLQVLLKYMAKHGVEILLGQDVEAVSKNLNDVFEVAAGGQVFRSKACIIATGGKSRPETGSTGAGFRWLKKLGHTIKDNNYALVPIKTRERWVADIAGISFNEIGIQILLDGKPKLKKKGKVLFTHVGLSGPGILNLSRDIGELLPEGEVSIHLDLFPNIQQDQMKQKLNDLLITNSNRKIKTSLTQLLPARLADTVLQLCKISSHTPNHSVTKDQRKHLRLTLKSFPLTVARLMGADKAVVSSGGIILDEVNMKTMESKLISSLYVVGDVLNIDRPSGGYSLQICWSTGYVAGTSS